MFRAESWSRTVSCSARSSHNRVPHHLPTKYLADSREDASQCGSGAIADSKGRDQQFRRARSFVIRLVLFSLVGMSAFNTRSAFSQLTTAEERGLPPNSSFASGDVDIVNLQNGNLHISIPIYSETQRGGHKLEWAYVYDTQTFLKKWTAYNCTGPCFPQGYYSVNVDRGVVGGWREVTPSNWSIGSTYPTLGSTCASTSPPSPYTPVTNWFVEDPQGTQHPLPIREERGGACFGQTLSGPALDGSGITYSTTTGIISLPDGTQIGNGQISDANGNLYTFANGEDSNGRVPVTTANGPPITYTSPSGVKYTAPSNTTFTVLDSSGTQWVYTLTYQAIDGTSDACNYLGGGTCYGYSTGGVVPLSMALPDGRAYTFTYSGPYGDLTSMTLPTGAEITYTYGDFYMTQLGAKGTAPNFVGGRAVTKRTVTDDGTTQQWVYSAPLGTVTDPVGNVTTYDFSNVCSSNGAQCTNSLYEFSRTYKDSSGTLLKTVATSYASEVSDVLGIPVNVRPISVTTTLDNGQVTQKQTDYETFSFPDYLGTETATRMNPTEEREYDFGSGSPGPLLRRTDYTYLHNVTPAYAALNIVKKPSTVVVYNGAGSIAAQSRYEYDNYSHPNQAFTSSGAIQHSSSYTTGFTTRGNETAVSKWRSTDGAYLTTTRQFDDVGNVLSVIDPLGHQSFTSYADSWANNACVPSGQTAAFPTKVTNAKGQIATSTYNACTGSVASTTDPNSKTTTYTYDFMGRVINVALPDNGSKSTCYSDNTSGGCYSTSTLSSVETDTISSSLNLVRTTLYDSLGRVKETQATSDPNGVAYVDTQYDSDGHVYKTSNPYRSGDTVYWTTNSYDGLGRLTNVLQTDGSSTTTTYLGNTTTIADEAGHKRESQVDGLGHLTTVWEDPAGADYETDYQYDVLGNLLQATQKGGSATASTWRVRTFTYNSLGQLLCSANPEIGSPLAVAASCPATDTGAYISGTTRYQYDNDGNVLSKTAPLENQQATATVVTSYTYDQLNRLLTKSYSDGTTGISYGYDGTAPSGCTPPSLTATNLVGRMSGMCDGSGATAWSYDSLGRTSVEKRKLSTVTDQIAYTYYLNGAVNTVTYPLSGGSTPFVATYNVNGAGRTYSVVGSNQVTYAQVTSTWAQGSPHVTQIGSNISLTDTYNSRLQPMQSTATQVSSGNTLFSRTYNFNLGSTDNGNLVGVTDGLDGLGLNRPNGSVNYSYDALNRITSASTVGTACTAMAGGSLNWASAYTIDPWGNLTGKTSTLCTGESMPSATSVRNQLSSATYDSAGNMTQQNGIGYIYNAEGQLASAASTAYAYDGMGERVQKPGKLYWKGVGSTALAETNQSDLSPTQYIFFNGARIARIDPGATAPKYYIADNLGSTADVTDSSGNILNESLFFPYGGERVILQNDTANNYKFTGKERDTESGLDDFGARFYNSGLGRFMTPDWDGKPAGVPYAKFGDPQTLNLYSYVENGPLNRVDADGHAPQTQYLTSAIGVEGGQNLSCVYMDGDQACGNSAFQDIELTHEAFLETLGGGTSGTGSTVEQTANEKAQQQDSSSGQNDSHYVSISNYPKGAGGFAHTGIAVDSDDTHGFSTFDPKVPWYKRIFGAPAARMEDDQEMHRNKDGTAVVPNYIHIPISAAQAQQIQGAIDARTANPGHYNLFFNNCAQQVGSALHAGGVGGVPHGEVFIPAIFDAVVWYTNTWR